MTEKERRVLSIQSHVVSGYCGNKAAVFPLQTLGYDVDVLNTVEFSNHTGYPSWKGRRTPASEIEDLFKGMETNKLTDEYTHLLTGYIGNASAIQTIITIAHRLKELNSELIFICDPVMGDDGELYVTKEVVPLYRELCALADVVTPNQTEAETLTSKTIDSLESARAALVQLHALGPTHAVITSVTLPSFDITKIFSSSDPFLQTLPSSSSGYIICIGSSFTEGQTQMFLIAAPKWEGYFTGTGDLFSSLLIPQLDEAFEHESEGLSVLARACADVMATTSAVVHLTWKRQQSYLANTKKRPTESMEIKWCELQVIKGRNAILKPDKKVIGVAML